MLSATGESPDSLTSGGATTVLRGELSDRGRLLLSLAVSDTTRVIAIREPDGGVRTLLQGMDARLAPTGFLLFTREEGNDRVLLAVPFDRGPAVVAGEPRVLERGTAGVTNAAGTTAGDLVYLAGETQSDRQIIVTDKFDDIKDPVPMTVDLSTTLYFHRESGGVLIGMSDQSQGCSWRTPTAMVGPTNAKRSIAASPSASPTPT